MKESAKQSPKQSQKKARNKPQTGNRTKLSTIALLFKVYVL